MLYMIYPLSFQQIGEKMVIISVLKNTHLLMFSWQLEKEPPLVVQVIRNMTLKRP